MSKIFTRRFICLVAIINLMACVQMYVVWHNWGFWTYCAFSTWECALYALRKLYFKELSRSTGVTF